MTGASDLGDDLVTVEEASQRLGVSHSQVHNLCKTQLIKVPPPVGRMNHPRHAAVITRASLEALLATRSGGPEATQDASPPHPAGEASAQASSHSPSAIHELKVQLDQARDELRKERRRADRLATLLVKTAQELRSSLSSREPLDAIADAYSTALTELLVDDDPGSIK